MRRNNIGKLTKDSLQRKKQKGERIGSIPYGYSLSEDKNVLVVDKEEQIIIKEIKRLRSLKFTLRDIAGSLTLRGYKPRGRAWYAKTISNILAAN